MKKKRSLIVLLVAVGLLAFSRASVSKNVILFIGDGMGINEVTAAKFYKDPKGKKTLFIDIYGKERL